MLSLAFIYRDSSESCRTLLVQAVSIARFLFQTSQSHNVLIQRRLICEKQTANHANAKPKECA
jgi:hypothetical protein